MYFQHSSQIWADFPELVAGVVVAAGVSAEPAAQPRIDPFLDTALTRLVAGPESEFPEIRAWRRTFARMGLKPTQYRCAAESLLRRLRKEQALPRIHPLIDLCNAVSVAFAVPVAVFDLDRIDGGIEVRRATGAETYQTFAGDLEHPEPGEVIFADAAGSAHARRWTNRQSGLSAVREHSTSVLVVAEAMHDTAAADIARLSASIADEITAGWAVEPEMALLTRSTPRFEFGDRVTR